MVWCDYVEHAVWYVLDGALCRRLEHTLACMPKLGRRCDDNTTAAEWKMFEYACVCVCGVVHVHTTIM